LDRQTTLRMGLGYRLVGWVAGLQMRRMMPRTRGDRHVRVSRPRRDRDFGVSRPRRDREVGV